MRGTPQVRYRVYVFSLFGCIFWTRPVSGEGRQTDMRHRVEWEVMAGELRDHPHIRQLRQSAAAYRVGSQDLETLQAYLEVAVFWNSDDAARLRREMDERLAAFGLRVAPEKTAPLNFDASRLQGEPGRPIKKPDTFTFLKASPTSAHGHVSAKSTSGPRRYHVEASAEAEPLSGPSCTPRRGSNSHTHGSRSDGSNFLT